MAVRDDPAVPAYPAATVVLLRDGADGCEVLLVRRNSRLAFHGGAWVFPGGRIDDDDFRRADADDIAEAARQAAVREAQEEAGLAAAPEELILFSRWITPVGSPKRFDAWFFAARAPHDRVRIDGGEIHDHRWIRPEDALALQTAGEIELPPPTFVTLTQFATPRAVADMLDDVQRWTFRSYEPRLHMLPNGDACSLYQGDAGYDVDDPAVDGEKHRLVMRRDGSWGYECSVEGVVLDLAGKP